MKRSMTAIPFAAILVATLAGGAVAQSDSTDPVAAPVTVTITFDQPLLAGYTASASLADGMAADASVADDSTLLVMVPSTTDAGADVTVALTPADTAAVAAVSANDASFDELVAALDGVGVSPADRWAREIMEYRPYDSEDASLGKLQDELAKYDPSAETLAGILSVLVP